MQDDLVRLIADPGFRKHAVSMQKAASGIKAPSFDGVFGQMERFAAARRREVRVALLHDAGRDSGHDWKAHRERLPEAVSAFAAAVETISDHATTLRPLITPKLDAAIALSASAEHPLHAMLLQKTLSLGFSREEATWLFGELARIEHRPVELICADGFEDLSALLAGISVGEGGLLLAGFVRFTQDPETDKRIENVVIRLRERGITASVFLALVITVVAHAVVACCATADNATPRKRKGRSAKK